MSSKDSIKSCNVLLLIILQPGFFFHIFVLTNRNSVSISDSDVRKNSVERTRFAQLRSDEAQITWVCFMLFDVRHVASWLTTAEKQVPLHKKCEVVLLFAIITSLAIVFLPVSVTDISSTPIVDSTCKLCTSAVAGNIFVDGCKVKFKQIRLLGELQIKQARPHVVSICHEIYGERVTERRRVHCFELT